MERFELSQDLARDLLDRAIKKGATSGDVVVAESDSFFVTVRMGEIEKISQAGEKRLGLRVFIQNSSATASTSDVSPQSIDRLIEDTVAMARATAQDPFSGLPAADQLARAIPDLDLFDGDADGITIETKIQRAIDTEKAAIDGDARITNSEGAEFSNSSGRMLYASSHGFAGEYRGTTFSFSVAPVATADGAMQRDYWYSSNRKYAKLESAAAVGQKAAQRVLRRLGGRKVKTCEVPVVFDSETAGSLLRNLASAISGYSLYKGASFMVGKLGEKIASEHLNVVDDGTIVGAMGSRPFDSEGLPVSKRMIVEKGTLQSYLLDTYSGKKLGMASTGNASRSVSAPPSVSPNNFYLAPGRASAEEIIRSVKHGLYITELIGFGVNMVTGDYSRGAVGIWIENGELAYPVEEITIAGNLKQMFQDIEMVGNDLELRSRIAAPTVKLSRMTVAGN